MFNPFKKPSRHNPRNRSVNPSSADNPNPPPAPGERENAGPDPLYPELGEAASADPDQTAALIDQLQADVAKFAAERDQAVAAYKQSLAEFANYQRRALTSEQQAREQAVRKTLESIIPVMDHFELALAQNPETATAKSVIDGVSMIKDELLRALSAQGVEAIRPGAGEAFDANRHKAIVQQPAEGVEPGAVVQTLRTGFMLGGRVIRPAEVIVAA